MKILKKELKLGKIETQAQSLDDLWYLSQIISKTDIAIGRTTRKVRLGSAEEAVKKQYILSLMVETVEFNDHALRISGVTTEPTEDIPKGSHHTITIEPGDTLTMIKAKWQQYQLDRIDQATQEQLKALIVVFDRESCWLAKLKSSGYEILTNLKGKVRKKGQDIANISNFYKEVITAIRAYDERNKPDKIIVASPAFWKDEFMNELKNDSKAEAIKQKITLATCSDATEAAIDEVLKRPEMETVLESALAAKEMRLVEEAMVEIAKDGKVAYGQKAVKDAIEAGAVDKLLISDTTVYKKPESEKLMVSVEESGGKAYIINSENPAGEKLNSLGGMIALLRYKLA